MGYRYQQPTPEEKMKMELQASLPPRPLSELVDKALKLLAAISFAALCATFFQFNSQSESINENYLATIPQCILTEPVRHEHIGDKKRMYYYAFKFRGHNLDCRFFSKYYDYAKDASILSTLQEGDTVTIQIDYADLDYFNNKYSEGSIDLLNLAFKNRFLVNHSYRNAKINMANKNSLYLCLYVFGGVMLAFLLNRGYWYFRFKHRGNKYNP